MAAGSLCNKSSFFISHLLATNVLQTYGDGISIDQIYCLTIPNTHIYKLFEHIHCQTEQLPRPSYISLSLVKKVWLHLEALEVGKNAKDKDRIVTQIVAEMTVEMNRDVLPVGMMARAGTVAVEAKALVMVEVTPIFFHLELPTVLWDSFLAWWVKL